MCCVVFWLVHSGRASRACCAVWSEVGIFFFSLLDKLRKSFMCEFFSIPFFFHNFPFEEPGLFCLLAFPRLLILLTRWETWRVYIFTKHVDGALPRFLGGFA